MSLNLGVHSIDDYPELGLNCFSLYGYKGKKLSFSDLYPHPFPLALTTLPSWLYIVKLTSILTHITFRIMGKYLHCRQKAKSVGIDVQQVTGLNFKRSSSPSCYLCVLSRKLKSQMQRKNFTQLVVSEAM